MGELKRMRRNSDRLTRTQDFRLEAGDIIGFSGYGYTDACQNMASGRLPGHGLSHMGILSLYRNALYLFEYQNDASYCHINNRFGGGARAMVCGSIFERPGKVWLYKRRQPVNKTRRMALLLALLSRLGRPRWSPPDFQKESFSVSLAQVFLLNRKISGVFSAGLVADALTQSESI